MIHRLLHCYAARFVFVMAVIAIGLVLFAICRIPLMPQWLKAVLTGARIEKNIA